MRGINKKILISLLTTLVVFITVFATTYAWVGIFTYANSDSFKMNLKVQDLDSNYFLTISSSGKPGTFNTEPVPLIEIKRQILNNKYNNRYNDESDDSINIIFDKLSLAPITTNIIDNKLDVFKEINYNYGAFNTFDSNNYYEFDLYFSVDTKEKITESTTGIKANVILTDFENFILGTQCSETFYDINPFSEIPSTSDYYILSSIPRTYNVNSKNALRVGFSIYSPISMGETYLENDEPIQTKIYQGGNNLPSYDVATNTYDLGGCLPLQYNTAANELLKIRPGYYDGSSIPLFDESIDKAINRGDLILSEDNCYLWSKYDHSDTYLGCMDGVQTKLKVKVFIWFEGWDADCLKAIDEMLTTVNLTFTSGKDD